MPTKLSTEYDIDPRKYLDRIEELIIDRHPPTESKHVEEVLVADSGPVDYLVWFALEEYEDHTFFYYDDSPDSKLLRKLLSLMPNEDQMPKFRVFLQAHYETVEVVDSARLFEIPDTYLPQYTPRPRANIGFFHSPIDDAIAAGINGVPRTKEEKILEDVDRLLPSRDVERFVSDVVQELYDEIESEIERHVVEADAQPVLESDPGFQYETSTLIPDGIHPEYSGTDGELWQKPVSKVSYLDGAQGFVQVWLPEEAEKLALVTVTSGEYDHDIVIEQARDRLSQSIH
jgi:hypothetical protein